MGYDVIKPQELLELPLNELIVRCTDWCAEFNEGKPMDLSSSLDCPVHLWVIYNRRKCAAAFVPNILYCSVCSNPCCPKCHNHDVEQLSRVTGYISAVGGWNKAKQQELRDRHRTPEI